MRMKWGSRLSEVKRIKWFCRLIIHVSDCGLSEVVSYYQVTVDLLSLYVTDYTADSVTPEIVGLHMINAWQ